jgi:hypothetical protein
MNLTLLREQQEDLLTKSEVILAKYKMMAGRLVSGMTIAADYCRAHGLTMTMLTSPSRVAGLVWHRRRVAIKLFRAGYTRREIGWILHRDGSTISHLLLHYKT